MKIDDTIISVILFQLFFITAYTLYRASIEINYEFLGGTDFKTI